MYLITQLKDIQWHSLSSLNYLLKVSLLFSLYFFTASFGLKFDAFSGLATLIWPPTGISLAFLLIVGRRYWPGVFLGALIVNLSVGANPMSAFMIGIGNTLEALIGAYWLRSSLDFHKSLERMKDIVHFLFRACFLSTLISSVFGVMSIWAF